MAAPPRHDWLTPLVRRLANRLGRWLLTPLSPATVARSRPPASGRRSPEPAPPVPIGTLLIRQAKPSDLKALLALERKAGTPPLWNRQSWEILLDDDRKYLVVVLAQSATPTYPIVAYLAFERAPGFANLKSAAVLRPYRRKGLASHLFRWATNPSSSTGKTPLRRRTIAAAARETNLAAQCWLRSLTFRCIRVERLAYNEPPEDGYLFRCRLDTPAPGEVE